MTPYTKKGEKTMKKRIYMMPIFDIEMIDSNDIIRTSISRGRGDEANDVFIEGEDIFR